MPSSPEDGARADRSKLVLKGTTLVVYRFIFRKGEAVGPHEIQRSLGLSSPSVASYHLAKLLDQGLVREVDNGCVIDRMMFENMVRVKRMLIPVQVSYVAFFATVIAILLTFLRPPLLYSAYYFSMIGLLGALALSTFEAIRASRRGI